MSFSPVRLNRKEIGRILKEDYAEQVNKLAGRIADDGAQPGRWGCGGGRRVHHRPCRRISVGACFGAKPLTSADKAAAKVGLEVQSK